MFVKRADKMVGVPTNLAPVIDGRKGEDVMGGNER